MKNTQTDNNILEVKNLSVAYGEVSAFEGVSISVNKGGFVAIIGPNGAGKSSLLKAITGILPAFDGKIISGEISYHGAKINNTPSYELVNRGIGFVPDGRRIFSSMTVKENLEMGAFILPQNNVAEAIFKTLLLFPVLKEHLGQQAGTLSGGEQQMLSLARALVLSPELLILDEPSIGLSPNHVLAIFDKLTEISCSETAILLVEQNTRIALEYAHRAYVFGIGRIAFQGESKELLQLDGVKKLFLGG